MKQPAPVHQQLRRILLAADMRAGCEQLFAHGVKLALAARATLNLVNVYAPGDSPSWEALPTVRELLSRWQVLEQDAPVEAYQALGLQVRAEAVAATNVAEVVVELAQERTPDLLLLGTQTRQGLDRLIHPSVGERIARQAALPALFIGQGNRGIIDLVDGSLRLSRVMLPLGGDVPAQRAVDLVARVLDLLRCDRAQITVVHVGDHPISGITLPARAGWEWRTDLRQGQVVPGILQAAIDWTPDLLVMATRGSRGPLGGLVGTRTERVLHESHCPVLSVPV